MTSSTRILISGLISADISFRIAEMPRLAEKYRAQDMRFGLGGGGAIAAVAARRLGADVQLAGRLGNDSFGALLRDELHRRSINHDLVITQAGWQSPVSSIFIDDAGERQIVNFRGAHLAVDDEAIGALPADTVNGPGKRLALSDDFASAFDVEKLTVRQKPDAVLVDTRWEVAAVQVLHQAGEWGVPRVVDAESPICPAALRLASHVAFSRQGLRDLSGHDDIVAGLLKAADEYDCWVCVTDGERGVFCLQNDKILHMPAFPVTTVDSLGAGDAWHAAFTLQLAQGRREPEAMRFANATAALKCGSSQGLDGMPCHDEVMALLGERATGDSVATTGRSEH